MLLWQQHRDLAAALRDQGLADYLAARFSLLQRYCRYTHEHSPAFWRRLCPVEIVFRSEP